MDTTSYWKKNALGFLLASTDWTFASGLLGTADEDADVNISLTGAFDELLKNRAIDSRGEPAHVLDNLNLLGNRLHKIFITRAPDKIERRGIREFMKM